MTDDDLKAAEAKSRLLKGYAWPNAGSMMMALIVEVRRLQAELAEVRKRLKEGESHGSV